MAKYYFAGTVSQIRRDGSNLKIDITPDAEYVASRKKDMGGCRLEIVTIAVFQPVDKADEGIAFRYANHVTLSIPVPNPSPSCICCLPFTICGNGLRLELETAKKRGARNVSTAICTCQIDCPKAKKFDIVRVDQR